MVKAPKQTFHRGRLAAWWKLRFRIPGRKLEHIDYYFLILEVPEVFEEPAKKGVLLNLILINKEEL